MFKRTRLKLFKQIKIKNINQSAASVSLAICETLKLTSVYHVYEQQKFAL